MGTRANTSLEFADYEAVTIDGTVTSLLVQATTETAVITSAGNTPTIAGIRNVNATDERLLFVLNDSGVTVAITSSGTTTGDRILAPASMTLSAGSGMTLWYSLKYNTWLVLGFGG